MGVWHVTDETGVKHDITCLNAWQEHLIDFDNPGFCQHSTWIDPADAKVWQAVDVLNESLDLLDPDHKIPRPLADGPAIRWVFGPDAGRLLADWLEHARYGHINQTRRLAQEAER